MLPPILQKIPQIFGGCQAQDGREELYKFLIFTWMLDYFIGIKYSHCFPWNDKLTLFLFEEMSVRYSSLNIHCLLVSHSFKLNEISFFQVKTLFCEKKLTPQTALQVFPPDIIGLGYAVEEP